MKIYLLAIVLGILVYISCSTGYLVDMNEITNFPEGRQLYVSKCSGCHKYHYPDEFTLAQWDSLLVPMQAKAKLSEEEKGLIRSWIAEKIKDSISKRINN